MKPLNDQVSNEYSCLMIFVGDDEGLFVMVKSVLSY